MNGVMAPVVRFQKRRTRGISVDASHAAVMNPMMLIKASVEPMFINAISMEITHVVTMDHIGRVVFGSTLTNEKMLDRPPIPTMLAKD